MAITTIQSGSPSWDVPVNANFAELDARITGGAQVVEIDNPFTFLDGTTSTWNTPYIRYTQLDGFKLVELNIDKMTYPAKNEPILVVPTSFAPDTQITIDLGMASSLQLGSNGKAWLWFGDETNRMPLANANLSVMYFRKDDQTPSSGSTTTTGSTTSN